MTNAYENVNLIKCLYVTHDAHTQPPMITKTTLQIYGPHLQQDITSTRSASLKKIPCSAYPVMHEALQLSLSRIHKIKQKTHKS